MYIIKESIAYIICANCMCCYSQPNKADAFSAICFFWIFWIAIGERGDEVGGERMKRPQEQTGLAKSE